MNVFGGQQTDMGDIINMKSNVIVHGNQKVAKGKINNFKRSAEELTRISLNKRDWTNDFIERGSFSFRDGNDIINMLYIFFLILIFCIFILYESLIIFVKNSLSVA